MASSSRTRRRTNKNVTINPPVHSSSSEDEQNFRAPNLAFENPMQQALYNTFERRNQLSQKFVDIQTLKDLFVFNQIKALFQNIGWGEF